MTTIQRAYDPCPRQFFQASNVPCYKTPEATCGHELVADTEYSLLADTFVPLPETFDSKLNHNLVVPLPETLDSMRNHSLLIDNFIPLPANPTSPANIEKLKEELAGYPDPELADYLIQGFTYGFDRGYSGKRFPLRSKNLHSALSNASAVTEAISKELSRGHVAGPFTKAPFENLHCSPLGAVPKKDGSYLLIIDISSPPGRSINEGISKDNYSVVFSRFDDAVTMVQCLGIGALMAKVDIKHAFRICPVRPEDYKLLGTFWEGLYFVELRLPFGLRSSVFIFNTFADALQWILKNKHLITELIHYLDDFFTAGQADSPQCAANIQVIKKVFHQLGVPLAFEKLEGPTTEITYLGIVIDSVKQEIRLPAEKCNELSCLLNCWVGKKKCTKRELLSLIGKLAFASKVVRSSQLFLCRFIDLSMSVKKLHHHISLNREVREDIQWWRHFLLQWNGVSIFPASEWTCHSAMELYTDASATIGYGAVFGQKWFYGVWPNELSGDLVSIQWKELFPIYAACFTWGPEWHGKRVLFHTDNKTDVVIWTAQTTKIFRYHEHSA